MTYLSTILDCVARTICSGGLSQKECLSEMNSCSVNWTDRWSCCITVRVRTELVVTWPCSQLRLSNKLSNDSDASGWESDVARLSLITQSHLFHPITDDDTYLVVTAHPQWPDCVCSSCSSLSIATPTHPALHCMLLLLAWLSNAAQLHNKLQLWYYRCSLRCTSSSHSFFNRPAENVWC